MWYNIRCWNGDEWVIFGVFSKINGKEYNIEEICEFIEPASATWCGYSFWLGADALQDEP